ncbi:MAG: hypothetical protein ACLPZR_20070 [Solirubrobacteraceae bacterium]
MEERQATTRRPRTRWGVAPSQLLLVTLDGSRGLVDAGCRISVRDQLVEVSA